MDIATLGPSPLLGVPRAVAFGEAGPVAWHYGDPLAEQRAVTRGRAVLLDGWAFGAVEVRGDERLSWLNVLASQDFSSLQVGSRTEALWLSARGHVEHWASALVQDDRVLLRTVTPAAAADLAAFLLSRVFRAQVTVADMTAQLAFLGGATSGKIGWDPVPRAEYGAAAADALGGGRVPVGTWALDALEIAARRPAFGSDSDERTVPNEVAAWMRDAVSMGKGCYCGQETVARIANIGAPPRRLVLLNLDGSADRLPVVGADVLDADGTKVGRVGRAAQHWEDGPVALALVKRTVAPGVPLTADGVDALIDPADVVPDGPKHVYSRGDFLDLRRR